ncbi:hypothetical protein [Haloarchaeobius sp. HRN-SO-5]|uniref:hypothetical protein n=1 Tax=Haloarchaeobius sp. HRN-SO-5 TaxID=3446118 RepID=UPI003EB7AC38
MPDLSSISRRQVLAAVGVGATGTGGYVAGVRSADSAPDWLASRECSPSPAPNRPSI